MGVLRGVQACCGGNPGAIWGVIRGGVAVGFVLIFGGWPSASVLLSAFGKVFGTLGGRNYRT